jgi:regulator of sigma E protease
MTMLMTVLSFLVTIGVLVVIHEYGHYRAAVACNVKVLRFSVGFGQVLWRRQRGETEFVISALPLGGYVKMLDEREGPVDASEQHRAFNRKPLRQRAFVVAAGPLANLLLAVVLYAGVNWAGVQELRPWLAQPRAGTLAAEAGLQSRDEVVGLEVLQAGADADQASQHVVRSMTDLQWLFIQSALAGQDVRLQLESRAQPSGPVIERRSVVLALSRIPAAEVDGRLLDRVGLSGPYAEPLIAEVLPGGPAEKAGLRAGDRVLQVNGEPPADAGQLRQMIRDSQANGEARALSLLIERAGQTLTLNLLPVMTDVQGQRVPRIEAALGSMPATVEVS